MSTSSECVLRWTGLVLLQFPVRDNFNRAEFKVKGVNGSHFMQADTCPVGCRVMQMGST